MIIILIDKLHLSTLLSHFYVSGHVKFTLEMHWSRRPTGKAGRAIARIYHSTLQQYTFPNQIWSISFSIFWKKKPQFLSSTGSGKKQRNVAACSMSLGVTVLPSFEQQKFSAFARGLRSNSRFFLTNYSRNLASSNQFFKALISEGRCNVLFVKAI